MYALDPERVGDALSFVIVRPDHEKSGRAHAESDDEPGDPSPASGYEASVREVERQERDHEGKAGVPNPVSRLDHRPGERWCAGLGEDPIDRVLASELSQ